MKQKHLQHASRGEEPHKPCLEPSWRLHGLVSAIAVACYLNGLHGDFVHDDIPAVVLNKDVSAVNSLDHVFRNDFWGTPMADRVSHKSYRPLTILTFRVNYLIFGLQPFWFHLTNALLHAVACNLFAATCLRVAPLKPAFALLAGLLFASHPIHTEAVTGIVGRADVLACVFFLMSLLAYHGRLYGKCHIWLSILLGGLSMLAKETGVTIFLLNLSYDFYLTWPSLKWSLVEMKWNSESVRFANKASKILTSLAILLALRLAILQGSLPRFSHQDNPAAFHPSLYVRVMTYCYLAAFNWWLLLCPATLSHDWQMGSIPLITSSSDSRNMVTCLAFTMILLLAIKSFFDFETQRYQPIVLGILLLVVPFLPATNLLVTVGFVVAERVLYIPSLGSILLVVYGIQTLWYSYSNHRQTISCFVILLLVTSCSRTTIRNRDWSSRESLLRAGLVTLPHNAKMHYNFANFLRDSNRPELAKTHYYMALKLWPSYASAHNNLGTLLNYSQEAERHFLEAIKHSADHANAHYNLGILYRKNNRSYESEQMLRRCIALEPTFISAYKELVKLQKPEDRGDYLKKVADLTPSDPYYKASFGDWLRNEGNYQEAFLYYWKSLKISPFYQKGFIGVAELLRKFGQKSRLLQLITRWHVAIRLKGDENLITSHLYLWGWQLKNELSNKAKVYDKIAVKESDRDTASSADSIPNNSTDQSDVKWLKTKRNKTRMHNKAKEKNPQQNKMYKMKPSSLFTMHQMVDSV